MHVALGGLWRQAVDGLLHLQHVQRGDTHDLGFAALEDGGAVHARQHLNLGGQLTDVSQAAAVDADLVAQNALADDLLGHRAQCLGDLAAATLELLAFTGELLDQLSLQFGVSCLAGLLIGNLVDVGQTLLGLGLHSLQDIVLVVQEERNLDGLLASTFSQVGLSLAQHLDERLGGLQSLSHDLLGGSGLALLLDELPGVIGGLSLDHHHRDVIADDATGDHHVEHSGLQLGVLGEGNPLGAVAVVDQCHTHTADGAGERQTRELGGHGCGVDGHDVVEVIGVDGEHGLHHLDLVADALLEGGAQWAVNQTGSQDGVSGGTAFAAEEAAGDAAGSVHALLDVHGQREEVKALARMLAHRSGREQRGLLVKGDQCGTGGLLSQTASLETDSGGAEATVVDHSFGIVNLRSLHW